jgi:hypothetical protein
MRWVAAIAFIAGCEAAPELVTVIPTAKEQAQIDALVEREAARELPRPPLFEPAEACDAGELAVQAVAEKDDHTAAALVLRAASCERGRAHRAVRDEMLRSMRLLRLRERVAAAAATAPADEAARLHLATLRLGQDTARGGIFVQLMVGLVLAERSADALRAIALDDDARAAWASLDDTFPDLRDSLRAEASWFVASIAQDQRTTRELGTLAELIHATEDRLLSYAALPSAPTAEDVVRACGTPSTICDSLPKYLERYDRVRLATRSTNP